MHVDRYSCYMTVMGDSPIFDVTERDGVVEVRGFTTGEVIDALQTFKRVRGVQADHLAGTKDDLLAALMHNEVPLTPPASLRQAHRLATRRNALLTTPAFTFETLAELRGEKPGATRTWFSRRRTEHRVFSVPHRGRTVIPAFQLTEDGDLRDDLADVLRPLLAAELDGWAVWSWMTQPTSFLSGGVPEVVAASAPARAATAARRFAARPVA